MGDGAHLARHVPGVVGGDPPILQEGPGAGPYVQGAGLAEAGDEGLARVEHLLDFVAFDDEVVRVLGAHVRGADDRDGVDGDEDVAVGGVDEAVDHGVDQPVVHRDHDAPPRDDFDVPLPGELGDLAGPRARRVDDGPAFDVHILVEFVRVADDPGDGAVADLDPRDAVVGQDFRAVGHGGLRRAPHHAPAVDRAVLDRDGAEDRRVEAGLPAQGLGDGDLLEGHTGLGRARYEPGGVVLVVAVDGDEQAAGAFDGVGVDAFEDGVLLCAFGGRVRIGDDVPASGVEKAVISAGRPLCEIDALDENRAQAAHCGISDHADACGAPAYDHEIAAVLRR